MPKKILTFGILFVILVGIFMPAVAFGQAPAATPDVSILASALGPVGTLLSLKNGDWSLANAIFAALFRGIGQLLMIISSGILIISGMIFDEVIQFTIVDMAKNIGDTEGIGKSITDAWATLRDIANMAFIFVLLFAAFKAMFDTNFGNFGATVKNIIIVALLINFSLFFSKVVIDASNIVSVGFYNSIASTNTNTAQLASNGNSTSLGGTQNFKGISGGYMRLLGLQTWYGADILKGQTDSIKIFTLGFMSSIFMLITAVILLIAGIMFATRFIILIFLMILSPLALIAYIIPGQNKNFETWKDALIAQSFFAPLFFALTWVVFKVGSALVTILNDQPDQSRDWTRVVTDPKSAITLLINYILIIGFSIAALVISKSMASKTAGFKAISGGIGTVALGGTALAGRNIVGRGASALANNEKFKGWAAKSKFGDTLLSGTNKMAKSSFDARGIADTKLGKMTGASDVMGIAGKAGGVGGFKKSVEDKATAEAKRSKELYGQTAAEKEKAEEEKIKYEGKDGKGGKKKEYDDAKKVEEERIRNERNKEKEKAEKEKEKASTEFEEKEKIAQRLKDDRLVGITINPEEEAKATKEVEDARLKLKNVTEAHRLAVEKTKSKIEETDYNATTQALGKEVEARKQAWEEIKNAGDNRQLAYAERVKTGSPVSTSTGAVIGATIGSVIPIVGTIIGAGIGSYVGGKVGENILPKDWAGNQAAGRAIRAQVTGPSKEKKIADLLKEDTTTSATPVAPTPVPPPVTPNP